MDVERLMQDLSVDQLQNIYSNLTLEMEEKKEELRQMVGRRYRDVLDASSSVRRVTQIADQFSSNIHQIRSAASERTIDVIEHSPVISASLVLRITTLIKLYHLVGTMDPLTDAYVLIIVGNMHRSLSVETKKNELRHFGGFIRSMSKRLIAAKLKLEKELMSELSKIDHPDQVTNQLTAIAILTKCSIEQLLDIFLRQKMTVKRDLSVGSQSLIDIVWRIRHTFECVQRLFVNGQLTNTLRIFRNRNWIPKMLMDYLNNEALSFSKCLLPEIESANEQCASLQVETVDSQVLLTRCNSFLESVCNESQWMVEQKCELFEDSKALIQFLNVVLEAFHENWSVIGESVVVYHKFFGNSLIDKFQLLINAELSALEKELFTKFAAIDCHPCALFKKRVPKFDSQLASGSSSQLIELVREFDDGLKKVFESVKTYESIGREETVPNLRSQFATSLIDMLKRVCDASEDIMKGGNDDTDKSFVMNNSDHNSTDKALSMARLYLSILQSPNSVISKCLSINNEQIAQCADMLRKTAEKCFCIFLDEVIAQCAKEVQIEHITSLPSDPFTFLSYIQEFEKLNLPEVGIVEVPIQINRLLFAFLHAICLKISDQSISHLCTRTIRLHIGETLRSHLCDVYERCVSSAATNNEHNPPSQQRTTSIISRISLQYLFDLRVLNLMFHCERFRLLIASIESTIDPFDITLLAAPIAKNARIAAQRYSVLFGNILVDLFAAKESSLNESYMAVVDIVPHVGDITRFSLIPRLSKHMESDSSKLRPTLSAANMQMRKKALLNQASSTSDGVRNTPSFSSFYKLSTSWFGN